MRPSVQQRTSAANAHKAVASVHGMVANAGGIPQVVHHPQYVLIGKCGVQPLYAAQRHRSLIDPAENHDICICNIRMLP